MSNLDAILEIAIGLVLVWLIISVITVEIQDIINNFLDKRSKFLETAILNMFRGEENYVDKFYEHPAIQVLYKKNFSGKLVKPDYIPNPIFAEVAFEIFVNLGVEVSELGEKAVSIAKIRQEIEEISAKNKELGYFLRRLMPNFDSQKMVLGFDEFEAEATAFKLNAENWFDTSMERASFWYKEKAKTFAFFIGLILALTFNIDTIYITQELWREPTLRQSLVAQAENINVDTGVKSLSDIEAYYEDLKVPVGWSPKTTPETPLAWTLKVLGLLISALAAMQGAPFWFDILRNLLTVKGSAKENTSPPPPAPPVLPPSQEYPEAVG